jgi:hypothetical protein
MLRRRGSRQCLTLAAGSVAAFVLTGCAIVDKYSDRAVEYNLQAEKTQQQNLLLNIVRASLRRPMQFTGLSSITGTASASGTVGGGYTNQHQAPYISLFPPAISTPPNTQTAITRAVTGTGAASGSMSGGPTFTVPVLDTQEFYQGILAPVSHQIIDYYVQQGFPPELLFDLFVSRVDLIVTEGSSCDRFTFRNNVRNDVQFGQFQALADYLLSSGFTTERVADSIAYGPAITPERGPLNASDTAKMVEAYSKASTAGLDIRDERGQYRLQRRSSHYRFCFAVSGDLKPSWLGISPDAYCGNDALRRASAAARTDANATARNKGIKRPDHCPPVSGAQGSGDGGTSQFHGIKLSPEFLDRIRRLQDDARRSGHLSPEDEFNTTRFRNKYVTFKFQTRSVEGILYYLGEITRRHLHPEDQPSVLTQVKTSLRYGTLPATDCDSRDNSGKYEKKTDLIRLSDRRRDSRPYNCENLFVLEEGVTGESIYSVNYDGTIYSIPQDQARAGRSLQVLELVKQLLALNTSAKQLPSSGVISIIGGVAQ